MVMLMCFLTQAKPDGSQVERTQRAVRFQLLWQALHTTKESAECLKRLIGLVGKELKDFQKFCPIHARNEAQVSSHTL